MHIIRHRRNTIAELAATPPSLGVEVDIRSFGDRLVTHHDPFVEGDRFEEWLGAYGHGTLILNVKEEGLEDRLLELMRRHRIDDFFFLDQSFPFLVRTARRGESRCAVRVSEFEPVETALGPRRHGGLGVDRLLYAVPAGPGVGGPASGGGLQALSGIARAAGTHRRRGRRGAARVLAGHGITADAVCTKTPERWR